MPETARRYNIQGEGLSREMVERVLDAADRCIGRVGFEKSNMTLVAREAEVSRQTVHRLFSTREQMVRALALRQVDRFLSTALPRLSRLPTAEARILELTLTWGLGLPEAKRRSDAFRSAEFREHVGLFMARTPEHVGLVAETVEKLLADAPDRARLRRPDDYRGMALLVLEHAIGIRYRFGGVVDTKAYRQHLRQYLLPALFVDN